MVARSGRMVPGVFGRFLLGVTMVLLGEGDDLVFPFFSLFFFIYYLVVKKKKSTWNLCLQ